MADVKVETGGASGRREFMAGGAAALLAALARPALSQGAGGGLRVQRLSWAGVKMVAGDLTVFIDPWVNTEIWDGAWKGGVVPAQAETKRAAVLLTHLHNDHFDTKALTSIFEKSPGQVVCHAKAAATVASRGFRVRALETHELSLLGDFAVTPVPAADGLDDFQVSWVVSARGRRVIHCGDTLWHGGWWKLGRQYGPFDAAFLPINGFVLKSPAVSPESGVPSDLTPEQAAAAAHVLGAKLAVPIHYGFNDPATYVEYPEAEKAFLEAARRRGQAVELVRPGDWMKWAANV